MKKSCVHTCESPKYIDTVSEMYKNRPSDATAKANPSKDWNKIKIYITVFLFLLKYHKSL